MADSGSLNSSLVRLWPSHFDSLTYIMASISFTNENLGGIGLLWFGLGYF